MLNKFHLQHLAVILKSLDWQATSIRDLEVAWWSPSHSLKKKQRWISID